MDFIVQRLTQTNASCPYSSLCHAFIPSCSPPLAVFRCRLFNSYSSDGPSTALNPTLNPLFSPRLRLHRCTSSVQLCVCLALNTSRATHQYTIAILGSFLWPLLFWAGSDLRPQDVLFLATSSTAIPPCAFELHLAPAHIILCALTLKPWCPFMPSTHPTPTGLSSQPLSLTASALHPWIHTFKPSHHLRTRLIST